MVGFELPDILKRLLVILGLLAWVTTKGQEIARKELLLMGSRFELIAAHEDSKRAWETLEAAEKEIRRIEIMISSWMPNSYTSQINVLAGKEAVQVPEEMFQLITRAQKVSELTQGAFSLAFGSVYHLYQFGEQDFRFPSKVEIDRHIPLTDYRNIQLNPDQLTVMLKYPRMKIGFGAIGKGYAADRAKAIMLKAGILAGCVNAGGDLITWGSRPDGTPWNIGISHPRIPEDMLAYIPTKNKAIVTSGDYEKYFIYKGKRYSHIVDPRNCRPVQEISSATVICPSTELGDALATAICVLGKKDGLLLINKLEGIEAIVVDQNGEKFASENIILEDY